MVVRGVLVELSGLAELKMLSSSRSSSHSLGMHLVD